METVTMASIISSVGEIITAAMTWAGSAVSFITSQPLILMFVLISLVGIGIGLVRRFLRVG